MKTKAAFSAVVLLLGTSVGFGASPVHAAAQEKVKVGAVKIVSNSGFFLAKEKGYFAEEGLDVEAVAVETPAATAAAVASGDLDFAVNGNTVALYNLAAQGILRMIGGQSREHPTFENNAWAVSRKAYDAGLTDLKQLPGHSFATTSFGSPGQYALNLTARKYGFDVKTVEVKSLGSLSNSASALAGGQTDIGVIPITSIANEADRGNVKIINWVGDVTPWQVGSLFTSTKIANDKPDLVERFLRAYRRGTRDYHDAFTAADDLRQDQASAAETVMLLAKALDQPVDQIKRSLPYVDRDAEVDPADIASQLAWYREQNMLKATADVGQIIDARYAAVLKAR